MEPVENGFCRKRQLASDSLQPIRAVSDKRNSRADVARDGLYEGGEEGLCDDLDPTISTLPPNPYAT